MEVEVTVALGEIEGVTEEVTVVVMVELTVALGEIEEVMEGV